MHESTLVRDVVRRMVDLANASGARRIAGAKIWLGALSHFSPEHLREHFAMEARGTVAAGALLDIEMSEDPNHPQAQQVRLESVEIEE